MRRTRQHLAVDDKESPPGTDPLRIAMRKFGAFIDARTGETEIHVSDTPVSEVAWNGPTIAASMSRAAVGRRWDRERGQLIAVV